MVLVLCSPVNMFIIFIVVEVINFIFEIKSVTIGRNSESGMSSVHHKRWIYNFKTVKKCIVVK